MSHLPHTIQYSSSKQVWWFEIFLNTISLFVTFDIFWWIIILLTCWMTFFGFQEWEAKVGVLMAGVVASQAWVPGWDGPSMSWIATCHPVRLVSWRHARRRPKAPKKTREIARLRADFCQSLLIIRRTWYDMMRVSYCFSFIEFLCVSVCFYVMGLLMNAWGTGNWSMVHGPSALFFWRCSAKAGLFKPVKATSSSGYRREDARGFSRFTLFVWGCRMHGSLHSIVESGWIGPHGNPKTSTLYFFHVW